MTDVFVETERLILRRLNEADVDNLTDLDSDPEVMFFINGGRPTPRDEVERDNLPVLLRYYERYFGCGFWAAIERTSGAFIGWFHLRPSPEGGAPDEPELGHRLKRSVWGQWERAR